MDLFPIMGISYKHREDIEKLRAAGVTFAVVAVPWAMIAPHEKQAYLNHSQTLKRLAERGGLAASEAVAVIEGISWFKLKISEPEAHRKLAEYVLQYECMPHLLWAVERWNAEVKNRPLNNSHRRSLDDAWRQIISYFGGDPDELCGPNHDSLLAAEQE